jgi:hypothetical protein
MGTWVTRDEPSEIPCIRALELEQTDDWKRWERCGFGEIGVLLE